MEKEVPKTYHVEIRQAQSGQFYLESLKIDAETLEEMKRLLDTAMDIITKKLEILNKRKRASDAPKIQASEKELDKDGRSLFNELKELRTAIAKHERIKPYRVFQDSTLVTIAKIRPKTQEEMLQISGIGPHKFEKYGDIFINAVREYEVQSQIK